MPTWPVPSIVARLQSLQSALSYCTRRQHTNAGQAQRRCLHSQPSRAWPISEPRRSALSYDTQHQSLDTGEMQRTCLQGQPSRAWPVTRPCPKRSEPLQSISAAQQRPRATGILISVGCASPNHCGCHEPLYSASVCQRRLGASSSPAHSGSTSHRNAHHYRNTSQRLRGCPSTADVLISEALWMT